MKKLILLLVMLISQASFAAWPTFQIVPANSVLQELITTSDCPAGQGKIPLGTKVLIEPAGNYPNLRWYWHSTPASNRCHVLPTEFTYNHFKQQGRYEGGVITASYGEAENKPLFQLQFTIEKDWDCGPLGTSKLPNIIGCAMDSVRSK